MRDLSRQYELVLLGATGYTGRFCAEYITKNLPTNLEWAVAGRSHENLSDLVEKLNSLNPDRKQPDIEVIDLLREKPDPLVKKAHLVITAVGPYSKYGTPVVEACAINSTHYVDCSGEVPWLAKMIDKYHNTARENRAIMITQCGLDSVPADMISWMLVSHLRNNLQVGTSEVINMVQEMIAKPSGGTISTLLSLFDHHSIGEISQSMQPDALSHVPRTRPTDPTKRSLYNKILGIRRDTDLGILTDTPMSNIDTAIVHRSWALYDGGTFFGKNFEFSEWKKAQNAFSGSLTHYGLGFLKCLLLIPLVRRLLKKFAVQPGQGPKEEEYQNDRIEFRAVAIGDSPTHPRVSATFKFEGSIYYLSALAMCEAAMVILRGQSTEAHSQGGGIMTPACLGDEYIERLKQTGVVLDIN